eukprot:6478775-Amphidinium_carterae.2
MSAKSVDSPLEFFGKSIELQANETIHLSFSPHISRTQSTLALSSAEAELYAMRQGTIETQHTKQVFEEAAIPEIDTESVTIMINTDSSSWKAVSSKLGRNRKSKHVQLKFLYIQDVIQRGELTIKQIPTTHNSADVLP